MVVHFTVHALEAMTEHGASKADVLRVLTDPLHRRLSYESREEVYGQATDGRTLKVVIVEGSAPAIIVTVMPFSSRRLRRLMDRESSAWPQ